MIKDFPLSVLSPFALSIQADAMGMRLLSKQAVLFHHDHAASWFLSIFILLGLR